jgi:uncharacterized repeat protein (TIGR01451 family)
MTMDVPRALCRCLPLAFLVGLAAAPQVAFGQADIAVRKSVDVAIPAPGQPVQFTVDVSNVGSGEANSVIVYDKLPPGLVAPDGTGVFVSAGDYDAAAGTWSISQLAAGAEARLVMPAIVGMTSPPRCLVNVAENRTSGETATGNDRATAAVKQDAAASCTDVVVSMQAVTMSPLVCSTSRAFDFFVELANRGPDAARDVIVDLTQSPQIAPGLRFVGSQCSGTRCRFDVLEPGSSRLLEVQSNTFANGQGRTLRFAVAASTAGIDYEPGDNQDEVDYFLAPFLSCDDIGVDGAYAISGSCFIATAAYGSPAERHVAALRQFRDRVLRRSAAGRAFIAWYYEHSPPIARYISTRPWARAATRALLTPVVAAVVAPWWTLGAVLLLAWAPWAWRRARAVA